MDILYYIFLFIVAWIIYQIFIHTHSRGPLQKQRYRMLNDEEREYCDYLETKISTKKKFERGEENDLTNFRDYLNYKIDYNSLKEKLDKDEKEEEEIQALLKRIEK